ncbi:MAG: ion channel [Flavobacterium sp.]
MEKNIISILKTNFSKKHIEREFPYISGILLILTFIVVFIVPIFPELYFTYFFTILITCIFFSAVFSLKNNHILLVTGAVLLSTGIWISILNNLETLSTILKIFQFFFFLFLVGSLITQISRTTSVTLKVIIDSITGYLLLGFAFNIIVTVISILIPNAYNVNFISKASDHIPDTIQNNMYYTFITFTTTGYGDILPTHPLTKSLAVLISVSGQLYIAIIIAMLVGKYSSSTNN